MRKLILGFLLLSFSYLVVAQPNGGGRPNGGQMPAGRFYGKVVDSKTGKPIEYASVQLVQSKMDTATKKRKDVVVAGMLTKANGDFSLENVSLFGQSKLKITVVGFK